VRLALGLGSEPQPELELALEPRFEFVPQPEQVPALAAAIARQGNPVQQASIREVERKIAVSRAHPPKFSAEICYEYHTLQLGAGPPKSLLRSFIEPSCARALPRSILCSE
jgi:hypothetical protein